MNWFKNVCLISSYQDHYAPFDSARIEVCKEALSATKSIAYYASTSCGNVDFDVNIDQFETVTSGLTARTLAAVRKALRDAKLTVDDVKGVVMVGGSTRMPQIQREVAKFFGRAPLTNLNPDEVVALGAAIQAAHARGLKVTGHLGSVTWPEALALGKVFQELPPWLIIYGIEGQNFGPGQEVSQEVAAAIPEAVRQIRREIQAWLGREPPKGHPPKTGEQS